MKRKNIGIFTGVLLSAFAALNLNAAAIKTGTSAPKMKPVLTVEYEYSRSGQIIGRKINGRKQSYKYDKKGQLLGVYDEKGNAVEEYVYDPAGNILKKTIHGRTTTYKYDKANQLVSSECNKKVTKYEYDAAGRLVKEGDKVYSYIGLDKIESVTEGGRKLSSETFHWDGLALIQRNSTSYVNEPAVTGGNPILADDKILFNDMLGTTLGVKDGDKVAQNNLTAFGESLSASPMQDSFFTGKPHVGELGYAFLFRNYRADQGKWQTSDLLGYPDGWNNLAYVNNIPNRYIDHKGFFMVSVTICGHEELDGDPIFGTAIFQYLGIAEENGMYTYLFMMPWQARKKTVWDDYCQPCNCAIGCQCPAITGSLDPTYSNIVGNEVKYFLFEEMPTEDELATDLRDWVNSAKKEVRDRLQKKYGGSSNYSRAGNEVRDTIYINCECLACSE